MGLTCSKHADAAVDDHDNFNNGIPDPEIYNLLKRSVQLTQNDAAAAGQFHLLYKQQQHQQSKTAPSIHPEQQPQQQFPTRLVVRRHPVRPSEEGESGTHIYALRWTNTSPTSSAAGRLQQQEQCPRSLISNKKSAAVVDIIDATPTSMRNTATTATTATTTITTSLNATEVAIASSSPIPGILGTSGPHQLEDRQRVAKAVSNAAGVLHAAADACITDVQQSTDHLFATATMSAPPKRKVADWVAVSAEHSIFVADVGLSVAECNHIVTVTEQQCRGQYAAYTYAKQTLGCREFPALAWTVQDAVHTVVAAILDQCGGGSSSSSSSSANGIGSTTLNSAAATAASFTKPRQLLSLDDREPHMVKYDVTKKERQKLDMHTDKSEWTFLIAVSNGAGADYSGGGTYFECLDATVHVQRGHALIFPGKLRHCGQRISSGLRFLLVGFLVDKTPPPPVTAAAKISVEDEEDLQQQRYISDIP